jgi:hypothetical protein
MTYKHYNLLNVLLTGSGFLFSGYMSGVKFFTSTCAYQEPCPLFLGYPACYFGFGLFTVLFLASVLTCANKVPARRSRSILRIAAGAGVVFAGYFLTQEISGFIATGFQPGELFLPTCAYGLVFFLSICALSFYRPGTSTRTNPSEHAPLTPRPAAH